MADNGELRVSGTEVLKRDFEAREAGESICAFLLLDGELTGSGDLKGDGEELCTGVEDEDEEVGGVGEVGQTSRPAQMVWHERWYIFTRLCFSPSLCFFFFFFFTFFICSSSKLILAFSFSSGQKERGRDEDLV